MNLPNDLSFDMNNPGSYLGNIFSSHGLYSKTEINNAKFNKYSRFGRVLDSHGRLNNTREYLFFVKPDLHIVEPNNSQMIINPELEDNDFFVDLVRLYPDVVRELQLSATGNGKDIFSHLLSFCVNSSLDLPGIEASVIDGPSTVFGTSIEYLGNAEGSDESHSFSLEFVDSKELELYQYFKAYQEYQIARKSGTVYPIRKYIYQKRLHNVMGCYKFLVSEDMETIIHWSYLWGVMPLSCPREAFSDSTFPDGLTYSVNFKAIFIEDMKPWILREFNSKMAPLIASKQKIPTHELLSDGSPDVLGQVIGTLPSAAYIKMTSASGGHNGRPKYKFEWY